MCDLVPYLLKLIFPKSATWMWFIFIIIIFFFTHLVCWTQLCPGQTVFPLWIHPYTLEGLIVWKIWYVFCVCTHLEQISQSDNTFWLYCTLRRNKCGAWSVYLLPGAKIKTFSLKSLLAPSTLFIFCAIRLFHSSVVQKTFPDSNTLYILPPSFTVSSSLMRDSEQPLTSR